MFEKIMRTSNLSAECVHLPRPLVFTNGVFDILHCGHVLYLHEARQMGGCLFVGLNSDTSARLLGKGPNRPLNNELDRATVLAGLTSVSAIGFFDEQTPLTIIRLLKPDIYVKGGDYDVDTLAEGALVKSWGGRAHALSFVSGFSTTDLVDRIRSGQ